MAYRLITGATGLLGSYLLRDLLLKNESIAVLVRPTRQRSGADRVDCLLSHWEECWKRNLPRPVVLEGDIRDPLLGLDETDQGWLSRNADRVLHSAASLTFQEKDGEPWSSNVEGVRNVLELCRASSLRCLEHVSTAYVCGLRTGRVLESELDTGQEFGNDYERSKVQAEKLVRSDGFLDAYTILRPSIIVGDSISGYTTTFHGFYTPLRIALALLTSIETEEALDVNFLELLGLTGQERKNFVPVDWVSEAMTAILSHHPPRNETYALVSDAPVHVERMPEVFLRIVYDRLTNADPDDGQLPGLPNVNSALTGTNGIEFFRKSFIELNSIYQSYWRDDPIFDFSNTRRILPNRPCPQVNDHVLELLCNYALDANFGFPPRRTNIPPFLPRHCFENCSDAATSSIESNQPNGENKRLAFSITGLGGGTWTVESTDNGHFAVESGNSQATTNVWMTSDTFERLICGEIAYSDVIEQSHAVVVGDQDVSKRVEQFLSFVSREHGRSSAHREETATELLPLKG